MKMKSDYLLKEIVGNYVVIPVGQNIVDYKKILHLNQTGAFICKCLEEEITYEDLLNKLYIEYEAEEEDKAIIQSDLDEFLKCAEEGGLINR